MDTKECKTCKESKALDQYSWKYKSRGTRQAICKPCARAYGKLNYQQESARYKARAKKAWPNEQLKNKALLEELRTPCVKCGFFHPGAMDFHHIDPTDKVSEVVKLVLNNRRKAREEAKKCICLCANCHRILHWEERHTPLID